ncbi:serine hydrolase [Salipiger abyssi]|uniref:Beta-lactamase enzyme family protein n=1 Tax=Salipiger abyssi TaxID=1250539 RepID=A0A1P8UPP6_9RHOB|nr:serine hydrolase [Salipiger abyssi]APZ51372.1 Beta-lactamase enzyme family protein [Salipiger abyssi]
MALAMLLGTGAASAEPAPAPDAVLRALLDDGAAATEFTPDFLQQVPRPALEQVLGGLREQLGPVTGIETSGDGYTVLTETHRVPARIGLDAGGRVALLWFGTPEPRVADLAAAEALLSELGQDVAWLALREGETLAAHRAGEALAVGSAFKLGVLSVLADQIAAGRRDWADVLRIGAHHRSLPSGRMQDFPEDAPVTLHTAALAMIAESDNTATDLLLDTLGRDAVAARLGLAPGDLLSTREFFGLKADADLRREWLAAEVSDRPALAARAARTLPPVAAVTGPHVDGLEWTLPLERLCALGAPLAELPLMQVNPGPVPPGAPWTRIAYKGGSETGVLNFTALLRDADGRDYCAALTVNDPGMVALDTAISAFGAFLRSLTATP